MEGCVFEIGGGPSVGEGLFLDWRGCVSVGGGVFVLEGMRFIWRRYRCVYKVGVRLVMRK